MGNLTLGPSPKDELCQTENHQQKARFIAGFFIIHLPANPAQKLVKFFYASFGRIVSLKFGLCLLIKFSVIRSKVIKIEKLILSVKVNA